MGEDKIDQMKTKETPQRNAVSRKRLFDRRRYKHIGWCICDDPEVDIDTETLDGVKELLSCCMLMPHMQYDRKLGAFLLAHSYAYDQHIVLEISTFERYAAGFVENVEYYSINPSDQILKEIDAAIDKEWTALIQRINNASR